MNQSAEQYIAALTGRYGEPASVVGVESDHPDLGLVLAITFRDYPQPGLLTGFTYGLSAATHPAWREAKPELVITVQSTDEAWVHAVAYLAEWQRTTHDFAPGSLFRYGKPAAPDSVMDSFLVFEPAAKDEAMFAPIGLDGGRIILRMVYPLYAGEVGLIQKVGIRKFMGLPQYDFFSVNRPDLSTLYRVG
ncbi:MAG: hypothetical protein AVDCRST_MAG56-4843 [uncultured Cytophagales bacterium]|uniref:Suppressor of fused-like domain-containing protein n=1 Tax=uncultured Cytophagales bacterium TaxID=158755 RepID=A0A6J4K204_9SPHI|nr:MAG: hypothetical protein AVDCRST_MAG56-4843 [uncultured Cytophagales bacterium]